MLRLALKSLAAHKLRTLLTTLAILLGVAVISGTYVLTDQIDRGFTEIFADAYKGVDVTISEKQGFATSEGPAMMNGIPAGLVDKVKAVEGVAAVSGSINGMGSVAVDGKVVTTGGAPTLFFSVGEADVNSSMTPVSGSIPRRAGEVMVIEKLARSKGLKAGSPIQVITSTGSYKAHVSGVMRFGAESSLGGSLLVLTTRSDAEKWFDMAGRVNGIDVRAKPGTSPETLVDRIRPILPKGVQVMTGQAAAADQTKQISEAIGKFLRPALLTFGGIAVLVGAFIIFNAFSMTVAQRRREFAMLRALGASRRQVLLTIAGESLLMGIIASVIGLFAGLGVAAGINAAFKAFDVGIPKAGLGLEARTVLVALAVGIVVTVLSALIPAVRATRVPPIVAMQQGVTPGSGRYARVVPAIAVIGVLAGAVLLYLGMYGSGSTTQRLFVLAAGAVLIFFVVALLSRYFVGPLAAAIGWPLQRLSPISGRLARDNTQRNPARTAGTASALMIGLGVVVFVAVFAQGMKSSFVDGIDRTVKADYVVSSSNFAALPSSSTRTLAAAPGVADAAGLDLQIVQSKHEKVVTLRGIDPRRLSKLWRFHWIDGDNAVLDNLDADSVLIEEQTATSLGVKRGDTLPLLSQEGKKASPRVVGVYRDPVMLTGLLVGPGAYARLFSRPALWMVVVKRSAGADAAQASAALKDSLKDTPTAEVTTLEEFKDQAVGNVNQILILLYGLLAMSVIISLFGIVNTLVLSVYERTREIGLLRALGSSRSQVRSTVRFESVITSVMGGLMGIVVGVVFAYIVTARFAGQGITFSVPYLQLVVFLVLAVVVGVIAAILPARRAARIDILEAIRYE